MVSVSNLINLLDDCDLVITISSHGYASGNNNYIVYNGQKIIDYELNKMIVPNIKDNVNCLVLIDTCQSGSMIKLSYQTLDLIKHSIQNNNNIIYKSNIVSISATLNNQYDMDDISYFGFGGGLTSAYIDYIIDKKNEFLSIKDFFNYYNNRVKAHRVQAMLSFNNLDFL